MASAAMVFPFSGARKSPPAMGTCAPSISGPDGDLARSHLEVETTVLFREVVEDDLVRPPREDRAGPPAAHRALDAARLPHHVGLVQRLLGVVVQPHTGFAVLR